VDPRRAPVRLCMRDLYQQDLAEMIERETRQFDLWEILEPDDPDFAEAWQLLWDAFGEAGEMERREAVEEFLREDRYAPIASGTYIRYFLIIARGPDGKIRGVRDGSVLFNPAYAPDLCLVFLSHIFMREEARGTVLSYWLRIAPVDIAVNWLRELHDQGKISLPAPESPARYYGMRVNLVAEMEYFTPDERISWQRVLFYGRGGFDVINPRHFPYTQPDFRDPDVIRDTGNSPVPFMLLVRRMGRELQAQMSIDEASAIMRLLYDDFACFCAPEFLENSLQVVIDRLDRRAKRQRFVELLPLPTEAKNLARIKKLFRYNVYRLYYKGLSPMVDEYLNGDMKARILANPKFLDEAVAKIAAELEARPRSVIPHRERRVPVDTDEAPLPRRSSDGDDRGW
jgi:hypothetical protein